MPLYRQTGTWWSLSAGLVDVGLLGHATGLEFGLQFAVDVLVPQQGTACHLALIQPGAFLVEFLEETGGVRLVVGAAEDAHDEDTEKGSGRAAGGTEQEMRAPGAWDSARMVGKLPHRLPEEAWTSIFLQLSPF